MKLVRYLAWAWLIIIGGLMIIPPGFVCIKCGEVINKAGYIGDPAVMALSIGAIVLGLVGIVTEGKVLAGAAAKGATAGR